MSEMIKIGNIEVDRGEKKSGFLDVADGPISKISMPVTIIQGKVEGPTLLVTSGTHPCESAGVAAVLKICQSIQPDNLNGSIIAIPMINMMAFQTRTAYVNPLDKLNIEAIYPGKQDGSISERIAYNVLEIVKKTDYSIDCHGGDLDEMMYDNTWCPVIENKKIDKISKDMARSFGFEYICLQRSNPDQFNRTIESAKIGVPAIQTECGSAGLLNINDFDRDFKGITNVMKYLNMIEGTPEINVKQKLVESVIRLKVDEGGVFFPKVTIGQKVTKGETIGEIWNLHGELKSGIISPDNGVIRKIFTHQAVYTGRKVLEIFASIKPI